MPAGGHAAAGALPGRPGKPGYVRGAAQVIVPQAERDGDLEDRRTDADGEQEIGQRASAEALRATPPRGRARRPA